MKGDEAKAQRALERGIAALARQKYPERLSELEDKAKNKVKNTTGMDPETAARTLAAIKLAAELSQGKINQNIGGLGIEAEITPEEKRIMLKKDWNF